MVTKFTLVSSSMAICYLDTDHIGFQLSGWTENNSEMKYNQLSERADGTIIKEIWQHLQSLIDRQIFFCVINLPFGVVMLHGKKNVNFSHSDLIRTSENK